MLKENVNVTRDSKVVDIDEERKSNFSIFNSVSDEKRWMKRVEGECLKECMKEENEASEAASVLNEHKKRYH